QVLHQEWREHNVAGALGLLNSTDPERRGWEWHYLHRLCHSDLLTLAGHTELVTAVAWSPDGTRLVTASWDSTARVWDANTGKQLAVLKGHTNRLESAAWSPDGTRILTTGEDKTARGWEADRGKGVHVLTGHWDEVRSASWSPDGWRVLTAAGSVARIWDAGNGTEVAALRHAGVVFHASWPRTGHGCSPPA